VTWAARSRSDLVRIPRYKPGKESATRIELRSPDPACNPYLAFSVILAAGLEGIERNTPLPPATDENVQLLSGKERAKRGIRVYARVWAGLCRISEINLELLKLDR